MTGPSDGTRVCRVCGERKLLVEFYVHPRHRARRSTRCKPCARAYQLKYRERNLEEVRRKDRLRKRTRREVD